MKAPWKTNEALDPERNYVAVATVLSARRFGSTGAMFRGARATAKQMAATPGCVGFASQARPLHKEYRSISLWESEEALAAFVHHGAHGDLVRTLDHEVLSFRAEHWSRRGDEGRPTWREGRRRLASNGVASR